MENKVRGISIRTNAERRAARMNVNIRKNKELDRRTYNMAMFGYVIYGLIANAIICLFDMSNVINQEPLTYYIMYIGLAMGGCVIVDKSSNPKIGFLGYNMAVLPFGAIVSSIVSLFLSVDPQAITMVFLYTGIIIICMFAVSWPNPYSLTKFSTLLFPCILGALMCGVMMIKFSISQMAGSLILAILFSLYIGYNLVSAQQYPKTLDNAMDSVADIYINIINLFMCIVNIIGDNESDDIGNVSDDTDSNNDDADSDSGDD